jgi:hypothetical protein
MAKIENTDTDKLTLGDFIATADAGIAQNEADAIDIAAAVTIEDFRTILLKANNREKKMIQAFKVAARKIKGSG